MGAPPFGRSPLQGHFQVWLLDTYHQSKLRHHMPLMQGVFLPIPPKPIPENPLTEYGRNPALGGLSLANDFFLIRCHPSYGPCKKTTTEQHMIPGRTIYPNCQRGRWVLLRKPPRSSRYISSKTRNTKTACPWQVPPFLDQPFA